LILLLAGWWAVNLLQAGLTDLNADEAYYWCYAQAMAWGYFDHPPMIAAWVWLGTHLQDGDLGVRLLTTLAQPAALWLLWLSVRPDRPTRRDAWLFIGLAASIPVLSIYGFIATPDSPLLFFASLFLYAYRRFLRSERIGPSLLLAVAMAGMMYSKYHGILVIGFVVLSNPRLLLNPRFWWSGIMALLLFAPHLWWQFDQDFPSFQYHLSDRSRPLRLKHILNFWPNQLLAFNPLLLVPGLVWLARYKSRDLFDRAGMAIIGGFLAFFFVSSYRGHVEPHWTAAAQLPFLLLAFQIVRNNQRIGQYIFRFVFPSILLLAVIRAALVIDFLPVDLKFHGYRAWARDIARQAGDRPVLFIDSYQRASLYRYFTRRPATSLNTIYFRRNQFDLWAPDLAFAGKPALLVPKVADGLTIAHRSTDGKTYYLRKLDPFVPALRIRVNPDLPVNPAWMPGDTVTLAMEVSNPYGIEIPLHDPDWPLMFFGEFFPFKPHAVPLDWSPDLRALPAGSPENAAVVHITATLVVPDLPPGDYPFAIGIQSGSVPEGYNSTRSRVTILERMSEK